MFHHQGAAQDRPGLRKKRTNCRVTQVHATARPFVLITDFLLGFQEKCFPSGLGEGGGRESSGLE